MSERPRPQYGEYATPEDQASASGKPAEPVASATTVTPPHTPPHTPTPTPEGVTALTHTPEGERAPTVPLAPYAPNKKPRAWDRPVTAILIALGLYSVLSYFGTLRDLGAVLSQAFTTAGYGEFQSVEFADDLGLTALVIIIVLFGLSTTLALSSLRARRLSFWIPLTGSVISMIVVVIVMMVIVFADPGFQAYVDSISTP
ncbi:MAG: DUF6264 family protein [Microbacteriaceae bacterium]